MSVQAATRMNCLYEALAGVWLGTLRRIGAITVDESEVSCTAQEKLQHSVEQLKQHEAGKTAELATLAIAAREKRAVPRELRPILLKSKNVRKQLADLSSRRQLLESQLETIQNSVLNKTVLMSLQDAAIAMKTMGLNDDVSKADSIIADLEEHMHSAREMGTVVGTSLDASVEDDDALQRELAALLGDEDDALSVPAAMNNMAASVSPEKRLHDSGAVGQIPQMDRNTGRMQGNNGKMESIVETEEEALVQHDAQPVAVT